MRKISEARSPFRRSGPPPNGRTYVGYTKDLVNRLKLHNTGQVKATKYRFPLDVFFTEEFQSERDAKKRELYWKSGAGRRKLREYFKDQVKK